MNVEKKHFVVLACCCQPVEYSESQTAQQQTELKGPGLVFPKLPSLPAPQQHPAPAPAQLRGDVMTAQCLVQHPARQDDELSSP